MNNERETRSADSCAAPGSALREKVKMILTLTAEWEPRETRRGVTIYRRKARTGTSGGNWAAAGHHPTLKAARDYVDRLASGHYCGNGEYVTDAAEQ